MAEPPREDDDLAGVDLSQLDLEHLDLDLAQTPSDVGRWLGTVMLLGLGAVILWLPSTEWFRVSGGHDSGVSFLLAGAGIVDGILLGRLLWRWGLEAARQRASSLPARAEPAAPPSARRRWLTLLAVLGGGAAVLWVPASSYYQAGDRYSSTWFLAAGGAVVVGILLGRWLLMQAAAPRRDGEVSPRLVLPPWFKWVTLAVLVGTAVVVLVGKVLGSNEPGAFEFSLGAAGFIAGVGGAIWLARRFDEWERSHTERYRGGGR
jgi:hypothetical protein